MIAADLRTFTDVGRQPRPTTAGQPSRMTGAPPRVSIGMPVYNGMRYMERAVRSILAQSFQDFELIILDNASTDGSYEFACTLTDPRIRIERNDHNIGAIKNFIKAVELARGEYFMWAPVDDLWEPEFVARLAAALDDDPDAGVAMSAIRIVIEGGEPKSEVRFVGSENPEGMGPLKLALELGSVRKHNYFINGLFRRVLLHELMRFFPEGGAPERILLAQLALRSRFRYVDEVLYRRQLHNLEHELRYPEEAYSRVVAMRFLGDLHFLKALTGALLRSSVVPTRRKVYVPLVVGRFAATRIHHRFFFDLGRRLERSRKRLPQRVRRQAIQTLRSGRSAVRKPLGALRPALRQTRKSSRKGRAAMRSTLAWPQRRRHLRNILKPARSSLRRMLKAIRKTPTQARLAWLQRRRQLHKTLKPARSDLRRMLKAVRKVSTPPKLAWPQRKHNLRKALKPARARLRQTLKTTRKVVRLRQHLRHGWRWARLLIAPHRQMDIATRRPEPSLGPVGPRGQLPGPLPADSGMIDHQVHVRAARNGQR